MVLPDGNGRTGRLLINLELLKNGDAPVIIPDEKRVEYFQMISNYDTEGLTKMFKELQEIEEKRIEQFKDMVPEKKKKRSEQER
ncbi:MAG: hypothetical protein KHW81_17925 [[Clostridium] innocuum]|nr:hypothetical protein [[Clostridium] innocuum]